MKNYLLSACLLAVLISVGCGQPQGMMTAPIPVNTTPESVAITGGIATMHVNQTVQLHAIVTFSDESMIDETGFAVWNSSLPGIAAVSNGIVATKDIGSTTITALYAKKSATFLFTVIK